MSNIASSEGSKLRGGVSDETLKLAEQRHPGFITRRRISGFTVDCEGCGWRGFVYIEADAERIHGHHVATEAAVLETLVRRNRL